VGEHVCKQKAALIGGIPGYGGISSLEGRQPTGFELARQPQRRLTIGKKQKTQTATDSIPLPSASLSVDLTPYRSANRPEAEDG
jgi:hypothetical protein